MPGIRVHRQTLFKLPDPEARKKLIAGYEKLARDQQKDGKPYILFVCAGATDDADVAPLSQGYTIVAKTEFANMEDMRWYEDHCPAHAELKKLAHSLNVDGPPLTVFFTGQPQLLVP